MSIIISHDQFGPHERVYERFTDRARAHHLTIPEVPIDIDAIFQRIYAIGSSGELRVLDSPDGIPIPP